MALALKDQNVRVRVGDRELIGSARVLMPSDQDVTVVVDFRPDGSNPLKFRVKFVTEQDKGRTASVTDGGDGFALLTFTNWDSTTDMGIVEPMGVFQTELGKVEMTAIGHVFHENARIVDLFFYLTEGK